MKKVTFLLLVVFVLFFVFITQSTTKAQVDCPPGYTAKIVDFELLIPNNTCNYEGKCKFRAFFCVKCGISSPTLDIILTKIELLPPDNPENWVNYYCRCKDALLLPANLTDVIQNVLSALLEQLLAERFCELGLCNENPPSGTVDMTLITYDCFKYRYIPINCIAPVELIYCSDEAYCEKLYRICVYIARRMG